MKNFILIILCFSSSAFFYSCKNNNKNGNAENVDVSAQAKFISIPDADTILPSWSTENIVVNHWVADPDNLHPTNGVTSSRSWVLQLTSNYILRNDPVHLTLCPDIAIALPEISDDHLQYTFTLRTDATWDDGSPVSVEDVVFMFKTNKCPLTNNPSAKIYFENVKTIETDAAQKNKFTLVMKKEYVMNINFLADFPIIERKFYDPKNILAHYSFEQFDAPEFNPDNEKELTAWANEFNDGKYGNDISLLNTSGAYKVVEWVRGQSLILERKKNHWTSKLQNPSIYETSFPEKIIFKLNNDVNAQKLEFINQTMDASVWLSTQAALDLMQQPDFLKNYNIKFTDNYSWNYIGLNLKPDGTKHKNIFTDVKVRRAIAYLTPVDTMIQIITQGYAKRQASMVSPLKPEYNSDLQLIPYDIEAAKKLLTDAGWNDTDGDNIRDKIIDGQKISLRIELKYQSGQKFAEDMVTMIKETMYPAGVDVILVGMEPNTLRESVSTHDFDMYMSAWAGSSAPEDFTQIWHTSSYSSGGSNYVGFGNSETDALIDSIKYTLDETKRFPMEKRLQKIIYDEQPYIFLYSASRKNIIHKRFGNQYMTFDKPGNVLNNLKLLSLYGVNSGATMKGENP